MDSEVRNTLQDTETAEIQDHPGTLPPEIQAGKTGWSYIFPLLISILLIAGITQVGSASEYKRRNIPADSEFSLKSKTNHEISFSALLANQEFSQNLRDTVYTDRDLWLELRIDQQMLYVHYRDGREVKYPVSTGIPGASKSIESRPGMYAIFLKEEVHLSTQFNDARMNYFMPFNMGIGFHGLQGTGYYGNLGVRPSSHGCIRMRNEDVKVLFKQCDIGTLVLSHKGYSARTVAFAPEGFQKDTGYTKDDYMKIMAYNLGAIMEGKYFLNPPKRFVLDGTILPKSGVTVASTQLIPEKQLLPFAVAEPEVITDRVSGILINKEIVSKEFEKAYTANLEITETEDNIPDASAIEIDDEKIKKYSHNPLGILPYFGPKK
ncbi:MAG TPA: L,D-transpeptidase [Ignavibacteria bacterium]|nr:L,D-transpeptidase [Ignavibacteria bacterium]